MIIVSGQYKHTKTWVRWQGSLHCSLQFIESTDPNYLFYTIGRLPTMVEPASDSSDSSDGSGVGSLNRDIGRFEEDVF